MIYSFLFFLLCFLVIGILSATRKQANTEDYLIASRSVNPWLMALSAVATSNSGFMFVALIGTTYLKGLSSMWLMVGWVSGEYLAWRWVFRGLRERSQQVAAATIPSFLGTEVASTFQMASHVEEAN